MDKYVKRIKRKEDDVDADQFYVPSGYWMAANSAMACTLDVQQPAAPQKPDRPDTLPSPILSVSPEDLSRGTYLTVVVENNNTFIII